MLRPRAVCRADSSAVGLQAPSSGETPAVPRDLVSWGVNQKRITERMGGSLKTGFRVSAPGGHVVRARARAQV